MKTLLRAIGMRIRVDIRRPHLDVDSIPDRARPHSRGGKGLEDGAGTVMDARARPSSATYCTQSKVSKRSVQAGEASRCRQHSNIRF
jgi:hypothetical protein